MLLPPIDINQMPMREGLGQRPEEICLICQEGVVEIKLILVNFLID